MAPSDYVELRCRSSFSFLEAASNPEDLALRAAELDYTALALGDRDGVYGIPRFHRAATAAGVRPLVAAQVTVQARRARSEAKPSEVEATARRARSGLSDSVQRTWKSAPGPTSLPSLPKPSEGARAIPSTSPPGLELGFAIFHDDPESNVGIAIALAQGRFLLGEGGLEPLGRKIVDRLAAGAAGIHVGVVQFPAVGGIAAGLVLWSRSPGRLLV